MSTMTLTQARQEPVGEQVRRWRERRHRSQLDVSIAADLSARHLSFIETGRATPSRSMIARICEELEVRCASEMFYISRRASHRCTLSVGTKT
ncbi:helix-turn-helix transcriptional regulator [Oerskovia sp. M15]